MRRALTALPLGDPGLASAPGYGDNVNRLSRDGSDIPTAVETGLMVRNARERKGISLRALARLINVSPGTISAIENGKTKLSYRRLHEIAAALNTSASILMLDVDLTGDTTSSDEQFEASGSELERRLEGDWREYHPLPIGEVLLASLAVILKEGYHGASMRSIADSAGMSVASIYHHYDSKLAILRRLLDIAVSDQLWRLRAAHAEAGDDVVARIANVVECVATYHTQRWGFSRLILDDVRSLDPASAKVLTERRRVPLDKLLEDIERGVAEGVFAVENTVMARNAILSMCLVPEIVRMRLDQIGAHEFGRACAGYAISILKNRA